MDSVPGANVIELRFEQIKQQIVDSQFTVAAKECVGLIEFAFRELFRRSLSQIDGNARARVQRAESEIGNGKRVAEAFTLGELVALFRMAKLLDAWSAATGTSLRGIRIIDLDEIARLRNALVHNHVEATRADAELLFHCLQAVLETFGILSLAHVTADGGEPPLLNVAAPSQPDSAAARSGRRSSYRLSNAGEGARLELQADGTRAFDLKLISDVVRIHNDRPLVAVDVGCADGLVTLDRLGTLPTGSMVLGLDHDPDAIAKARDRPQPDGVSFRFEALDVEELNFSDVIQQWLVGHGKQQIDLVFSALTLHHVANPIRILRSIRYLLSDSGFVLLRGSDDLSKAAYPDQGDSLGRVLALTMAQPTVSDRSNGRKLHHWLYRAGFRDIKLVGELLTTSGLTPLERHRVFTSSFGYRLNYFDDLQPEAEDFVLRSEQKAEMVAALEALELDFEDDSFCYWELMLGAVARPGAASSVSRSEPN